MRGKPNIPLANTALWAMGLCFESGDADGVIRNLKEAMKHGCVSSTDVMNKCGINDTSVRRMLRGEKSPQLKTLCPTVKAVRNLVAEKERIG